MSVSVTLSKMHSIHLQLAELGIRKRLGPERIKAGEANIASAEDEVELLEVELLQLRTTADKKGLLQKTNDAKIADLEAKLNAASTNVEFQKLKDEIAAKKMANGVLDDEILEIWDRIEAFEEKKNEKKEEISLATEKTDIVRDEFKLELPDIQKDEDNRMAKLRELADTLPADFRQTYFRMVKALGEKSLAPFENNACTGCNTMLKPNTMVQLTNGDPTTCDNCGRLLYIREPQ